MDNINYQCMVYTLHGPMAKIDGVWHAVIERQSKVVEVKYALTERERDHFDLLNYGETPRQYVTLM